MIFGHEEKIKSIFKDFKNLYAEIELIFDVSKNLYYFFA